MHPSLSNTGSSLSLFVCLLFFLCGGCGSASTRGDGEGSPSSTTLSVPTRRGLAESWPGRSPLSPPEVPEYLRAASTPTPGGTTGASASASECQLAGQGWIWCDDFEEDRLSRYFEYLPAGGSFSRVDGVGTEGSVGMRVRFAKGQVDAGALHLAFGRTPDAYFRQVDEGKADYREIYWRVFLRNQPGWVGGSGIKLSRATVFATSSWAQAMVAHVWGTDGDYLFIEPVRGTDDSGNLLTTAYNDFPHFKWLGGERSKTPIFDAAHVGQWHCLEAQVRLNDPGQVNGVFRLWIDGQLDAERMDYDFVASYREYGINAVFLENYWNEGSPVVQERYFDRFVVSTQRIGC